MTGKAAKDDNERWRLGFHLMPPGGVGWLNDPNGCCQFKGVYHVYHQYMPNYPDMFPRAWGHAWSEDLAHWHHTGLSIHEDSPFDAHGSFSGCAFLEDGGQTMRLFFTGNFKEPGTHDYDYEGRWESQITTTSKDAVHFTRKDVLLMPRDYPDYVTCHVRDPKVWIEDNGDGRPYRMILGARDKSDNGFIMLYDSRDKLHWQLRSTIRARQHFGYMWECPDRLVFPDARGKLHEYLVFCPQRRRDEVPDWENNHITGYIPMPGRVLNATTVNTDEFILWDHGFDFYATQAFVDERGRTIMLAWMGVPDQPYETKPGGLDFWQCLTVPRIITRGEDNLLRNYPVPEMKKLRHGKVKPVNGVFTFPRHRADLRVKGIRGDYRIMLDDALEFTVADGRATLRFAGDPAIAGGRVEHHCDCAKADDIRLLVDSSAVEVFVNDGLLAFATRWFPTADELRVETVGEADTCKGWKMDDGMADVWEAREAAEAAKKGFMVE